MSVMDAMPSGFDVESSRTIEDDARIGEPQFRRECSTCRHILEERAA